LQGRVKVDDMLEFYREYYQAPDDPGHYDQVRAMLQAQSAGQAQSADTLAQTPTQTQTEKTDDNNSSRTTPEPAFFVYDGVLDPEILSVEGERQWKFFHARFTGTDSRCVIVPVTKSLNFLVHSSQQPQQKDDNEKATESDEKQTNSETHSIMSHEAVFGADTDRWEAIVASLGITKETAPSTVIALDFDQTITLPKDSVTHRYYEMRARSTADEANTPVRSARRILVSNPVGVELVPKHRGEHQGVTLRGGATTRWTLEKLHEWGAWLCIVTAQTPTVSTLINMQHELAKLGIAHIFRADYFKPLPILNLLKDWSNATSPTADEEQSGQSILDALPKPGADPLGHLTPEQDGDNAHLPFELLTTKLLFLLLWQSHYPLPDLWIKNQQFKLQRTLAQQSISPADRSALLVPRAIKRYPQDLADIKRRSMWIQPLDIFVDKPAAEAKEVSPQPGRGTAFACRTYALRFAATGSAPPPQPKSEPLPQNGFEFYWPTMREAPSSRSARDIALCTKSEQECLRTLDSPLLEYLRYSYQGPFDLAEQGQLAERVARSSKESQKYGSAQVQLSLLQRANEAKARWLGKSRTLCPLLCLRVYLARLLCALQRTVLQNFPQGSKTPESAGTQTSQFKSVNVSELVTGKDACQDIDRLFKALDELLRDETVCKALGATSSQQLDYLFLRPWKREGDSGAIGWCRMTEGDIRQALEALSQEALEKLLEECDESVQ